MNFRHILRLCRQPSPELMYSIARQGSDFSRQQYNYIKYLCSFTHIKYCQSFLGDFDITIERDVIPYMKDEAGIRHYKILIIDSTNQSIMWHPKTIARLNKTAVFINRIYPCRQDGTFVTPDNPIPFMSFSMAQAYTNSLYSGVYEEIISIAPETLNIKESHKSLYHIVYSPCNFASDIATLFNNVAVVIFVPSTEMSSFVNYDQIIDSAVISQSARVALWCIIDNSMTKEAVNFVSRIGASHSILENGCTIMQYVKMIIREIKSVSRF